MDLYRLSGRLEDLLPLNLDYVFTSCVSLIEWPVRLGDQKPQERLEICITIPSDYSAEDMDCDDKLRLMSLRPSGLFWNELVQKLLDSGYVDDLIVS
jgi:tRNA A37 threonylcarbamoyladenosine biosynthesis protein TsaE